MAHEIAFENIHKSLSVPNGGAVSIFAGLSLVVPEGAHFAVIGDSGVGKSTLLRLANRLEEPDRGAVKFGNVSLVELEVTDHRRNVAMVTQKACLQGDTVLENVMFPDLLRQKEPDREKAKRVLSIIGIESELFERSGKALSVGQQHRVSLARALYCEPKVLMLDETTSSLDPMLAQMVLTTLMKISKTQGMTILHVTHEMEKIRLADQVVLLADGCVAEIGPPGAFLKSPCTPAGKRFLGK